MRRRLAAALGALVVAASIGVGTPAAASTADAAARLPTTTPIKHFLVLMQANHSFDNYFGTYPGADGLPAGTCVPVKPPAPTPCVRPFPIGGTAITDLGPSRTVYDKQYDGGKLDGFIAAYAQRASVGNQPMGYYDATDIPYYWNIADNYVLFDRLFSSAAGGTVWNHMFWTTATPGNPAADAVPTAGLDAVPTIFDELQKAGIPWKFYVENYHADVTFRTPGKGNAAAQLVRVPLLSYNRFLDNPALHSRIVDMTQYYRDLKAGTLPAVSFMVPSGASEHPPGSIRAGERFVRSLVGALMSSPSWNTSAFMLTYDDWGGWYDHVRPPSVDKYGYGFRSPALLVSPYARRGQVDHTTLDFTSELKFIENNWRVPALAARDRAANDITTAFDFSAPPRAAVLLDGSRTTPPLPRVAGRIVYLSYGLAVLLLPLLIAVALLRRRRPLPTVVE